MNLCAVSGDGQKLPTARDGETIIRVDKPGAPALRSGSSLPFS